jgi:hypothetical protein
MDSGLFTASCYCQAPWPAPGLSPASSTATHLPKHACFRARAAPRPARGPAGGPGRHAGRRQGALPPSLLFDFEDARPPAKLKPGFAMRNGFAMRKVKTEGGQDLYSGRGATARGTRGRPPRHSQLWGANVGGARLAWSPQGSSPARQRGAKPSTVTRPVMGTRGRRPGPGQWEGPARLHHSQNKRPCTPRTWGGLGHAR